jgi:CheY-like chemotaxis protein
MQMMLGNVNCTYDIAETGKKALELGKSNHYDLILMDIQLPDLNGGEVTKELRACGIQTPIIATTAHAFTEEKENFLAVGMNAILSKPFRQQQILDLIAHWVKSPKTE